MPFNRTFGRKGFMSLRACCIFYVQFGLKFFLRHCERNVAIHLSFGGRKWVDYPKFNMDENGLYLLLKGLQNFYKIQKFKPSLNFSQENNVQLCPIWIIWWKKLHPTYFSLKGIEYDLILMCFLIIADIYLWLLALS